MKTSQEYRELAKARLETAQHVLEVTYPALGSPRLFLCALEHVFLSMDYAMNSLLADERMKPLSGEFPQTFSGRYSAFRLRLADRLGFKKEDVGALLALRNALLMHQKSPMEFERSDKFIICTNDYEMTSLSLEGMKAYVSAASSFLMRADLALEQPLTTGGASH